MTRTIAIASASVRLETADPSMLARVDERYAGFLGETEEGREAGFELRIEVDPEAKPARLHPVWVDNPKVEAHGDLSRAELVGEGFWAELDWEARRGRARVPDSLAHVDLALRVALGVDLLRRGDTLLHAAAVRRDGFALLFSGPSGAGKSTIAEICRADGLEVLADEMAVLRRYGAGTRVYGTPFWQGRDAAGPAGAVFVLSHAAEPRVTRISADRALPRLLEAGGAPLDLPAVHEAFFAALGALLRRVPAYELAFAPDRGFWDVIDRQSEFAFFRPRPASPASLPVLGPLSSKRPKN